MNEKKNRTVTIDGIEITATENLGLYPLTDTGRPPTVMLKGDSLWFGREPSKRPSVTIADSRMSSDHARLERVCADVYRLFDAKSKNGTWHNGSAAEGVIVADQDILRMGNSVFVAAPYLQPVTKAP